MDPIRGAIRRFRLRPFQPVIDRPNGLILSALDSPAGRVALAQAMIEPIKVSLEYQAVGRRLLMVDELPQGALARYERDTAVGSYSITGGIRSPGIHLNSAPPRGFVRVIGSRLLAPYSCFNGRVTKFSLSR